MNGPSGNVLLSLMFTSGSRPTAAALQALGDKPGVAGFSVTCESALPDGTEFAELLSGGLTFDCNGLAPGTAAACPAIGVLLGLERPPAGEGIGIRPGPHIAAGAALLPVVRILLNLGAALSALPGVQAIIWHPSGAWMHPDYFRTIVRDWNRGGVFPALGLAVFEAADDGMLRSRGLAFFTGQELCLDPRLGLSTERMAQLAIRLIDRLVVQGTIAEPDEIALEGLHPVLAVPVEGGRELLIRPQRHDR